MIHTNSVTPVFIVVWVRYLGGVHSGEVAQSGVAGFVVARVRWLGLRWLRLRWLRGLFKHRGTG